MEIMNKSRFTKPRLSDVPQKRGLYQIYRNDGTPLKVGISDNLRRRLMTNHRVSNTDNSMLAVHMKLDASLTPDYDFAKRTHRQQFLKKECYILWEVIEDKEELRRREKELEATGSFRYTGGRKPR
jgi:hypothetical protein